MHVAIAIAVTIAVAVAVDVDVAVAVASRLALVHTILPPDTHLSSHPRLSSWSGVSKALPPKQKVGRRFLNATSIAPFRPVDPARPI